MFLLISGDNPTRYEFTRYTAAVVFNEPRPRERSARGRFLPLGKKASSYRGAYRVPLFKKLVCVCACVCNIRRFY